MLRFENVYKTYKSETFSLADINFEIGRGEFVFLTGRTGAGKTTIIKMIYGEEKPSDGIVSVFGSDITKIKARQLQKIRRSIGLIFQEHSLIENKSVYENAAYPLYVQGLSKDVVKRRVTIALRLVELIKKKNVNPSELSGGEKQKACIARAIVTDPNIIIADEPTGNIDQKAAIEIIEILKRINEKGTTLIIATHDPNIIEEYDTRLIKLEDGRITEDRIK